MIGQDWWQRALGGLWLPNRFESVLAGFCCCSGDSPCNNCSYCAGVYYLPDTVSFSFSGIGWTHCPACTACSTCLDYPSDFTLVMERSGECYWAGSYGISAICGSLTGIYSIGVWYDSGEGKYAANASLAIPRFAGFESGTLWGTADDYPSQETVVNAPLAFFSSSSCYSWCNQINCIPTSGLPASVQAVFS